MTDVMQKLSTRVAGVLLLAALSVPAFAQGSEYKIGFINSERLFREAAPAKRAQQKLEKEFAGRDAEIQKLSKQIRDLQSQLEKDSVAGRRKAGRPDHIDGHALDARSVFGALFDDLRKVIQAMQDIAEFDGGLRLRRAAVGGFLVATHHERQGERDRN